MRIKHKPQDFRVRELLADDYLAPRGRWRVYRVTKKKLTSFEAARELANLARVEPADVGMAGLKDRQGVTTQYMSVAGGRPVRWRSNDLTIEPIGFAREPVTSACSLGNAFAVTLRRLTPKSQEVLAAGLEQVRAHGVVNYFGEQRFGNLRFGQGWVARDLALGEHERALRSLLCGASAQDDARHAEFKHLLSARWGNWRACRDIAGKFGAHHSVFEVLHRDPEDFLGALRRVAARLRLIHLYAWQSHVWNRAVARLVAETTPGKERVVVPSLDGPLFFARGAYAAENEFENRFRLPGAGLEDVERPRERALLAAVLELDGLRPEQFRIEGVGGFQLKGEDRELVVHPRRMALDRDREDPATSTLRFELPRGSYATVIVARLLGRLPEVFDAGTALERTNARAQERRLAREREEEFDDAPVRRRPRRERAQPLADPREESELELDDDPLDASAGASTDAPAGETGSETNAKAARTRAPRPAHVLSHTPQRDRAREPRRVAKKKRAKSDVGRPRGKRRQKRAATPPSAGA